MIATPSKAKISEDEFLAIWALAFGYDWVDWHEAVGFKEEVVGRHSYQLADFVDAGIMENNSDNNYTPTEVRLIRRISNE